MGSSTSTLQPENQPRKRFVPHETPMTPYNDPKSNHIYTLRNCLYRSERCELSPEEWTTVNELSSGGITNAHILTDRITVLGQNRPTKLIIDSDIGTDADDVLALLMAINLPKSDVELLGFVTNYHPTRCRAEVARRILDAAQLSEIPVIAGSSYLCGSHRDHFLHGNEGLGIGISDEELQDLKKPHSTTDAEDFIYKMVKMYPREVVVCAIGMMTNIGKTCKKYPDFPELVGHVVIMGGGEVVCDNYDNFGEYVGSDKSKWGNDGTGIKTAKPFALPKKEDLQDWYQQSNPILIFPNHNTSGDELGTKFLFNQKNMPISLIPHFITRQHYLEGKSIETLLEASRATHSEFPPEFQICGKLLFEWLSRRFRQRGQCPHDPLTVYEAVYPTCPPSEDNQNFVEKYSSLKYVNGTFTSLEWGSFIIFVPNSNGNHRLAVSCRDPTKWLKWLSDGLLSRVDENLVTERSSVKTSEF